MIRRASLLVLAVLPLLIATPAFAIQRAPVAAFADSQTCATCHDDFVATWSRSMHAQALTDPIYQYVVRRAKREGGRKLATFCESCHAPIAVMGRLEPLNQNALPPQAVEGVTCDFCHQISGTSSHLGNASFKVTPNGTKRAQFDDAHSPAHRTAYSALHETSDFCGTCHNVAHPVNGLRLETTYSEWKSSSYAGNGVFCQDCHMTPGPGVTFPNPGAAAIGGPPREHVYTMTFAGGNVGLGDGPRATANLRAAARIAIDAPAVARSGRDANVKVVVRNVGAGHDLPTGLTEVRQMWLEITATDRHGTQIASDRRDFGTVLRDAAGHTGVDVWNAVAVAKDDRIPPGGQVVEQLAVPPNAPRPITIRARLRYRSAPESLAKAAGVELPTTEMASASATIFESDAQRRGESPLLARTVMLVFAVAIVGVIGVRWSRRQKVQPGRITRP